MREIKPIDTLYNGYRFRSRLEARWAVFLDTLGIAYQYEPEGYNLNGIKYLPDFWLPDLHCWLEIKGKLPDQPGLDAEWSKPGALASHSRLPVHLFPHEFSTEPSGFTVLAFENIPEDRALFTYILTDLMDITRSSYYPPKIGKSLDQFEREASILEMTLHYISAHWTEQPSNTWAFRFNGIATIREDHAQVFISSQHYLVANTTRWVECETCHTIGIASKLLPAIVTAPCFCHYPPRYTVHSPRLDAACRAAKQARFEHNARTQYAPVPAYRDDASK